MSKCLNASVKKEAEMLFSPIQLGVGVKGGCEIIVHSSRSSIDIILTCVLGFKAIGRVFDFIELFNRP